MELKRWRVNSQTLLPDPLHGARTKAIYMGGEGSGTDYREKDLRCCSVLESFDKPNGFTSAGNKTLAT